LGKPTATSLGTDQQIIRILRDRGLAQFGDSLVNFSYSLTLTHATQQPTGVKVKDRTLANAAAKAGIRQHLPKRVDQGQVANSLEALIGYLYLKEQLTLDDIISSLKPRELDDNDESKPFLRLAQAALYKLEQNK